MGSCKRYLGVHGLMTAMLAAGALVSANPQDPHAPLFEGRWTVTLFLGFDGPALEIPIAISDRNSPRTLSQTFAVPGTGSSASATAKSRPSGTSRLGAAIAEGNTP